MSTTMVAPPTNGTDAPARTLTPLAAKVDQLHRLRELVAQGQAAEQALTHEILAGLLAHGFTRLAGRRAVATLDTARGWVPLPGDDADDDEGFQAYEPLAAPILRVVPLPAVRVRVVGAI